jgi:hypothetical protein
MVVRGSAWRAAICTSRRLTPASSIVVTNALHRRSIDLAKMELRVRKVTAEMEDGTQVDDDPKSEAGKRPIALPHGLWADIELHLTRYAQPGLDGRLFVGPQNGIRRRRNFNRIWRAL